MCYPLLHCINHPANHALTALLAAVVLIFSCSAHSDLAAASDDNYLLDETETNQRLLNSLWLEQGMNEEPNYYESDEALQKLVQGVIKKYWAALVKKDTSYAPYTPLVGGHFSSGSSYNSTDLDIKLSGDTIRFRLGYSF